MKLFNYYKTISVRYPSKGDFTKVFAYLQGKVVFEGPADEFHREAFPDAVIERVVDEQGIRSARAEYSAEQSRLEAEFKADLYEYHGVTGNPRAGQCFAIAWDDDHANGYEAVANRFEVLVDLIR